MVGPEQKKKAHLLKPILAIGKNGVTEGSLALIDRELKQKALIKIKILKSCPLEKQEAIDVILKAFPAEVVQSIGNIVVLYRKPFK